MIKIDIYGTDAVILSMSRASDNQIAGAKRAMDRLASRLYEEIVNLLSGGMLNVGSGKLLAAQKVTVTDSGHTITLEGGFDEKEVPYGNILIKGVSHSWDIVAHGKALKFQIGDETVFAKKVTHPPVPPKSFLATAMATIYPEVMSTIREEMASGGV